MSILEISALISVAILLLALFISLVRLMLGPGLQDRVVAFDLIASIVGGLILIFMIKMNIPVYMDIVIILFLVLFLGTVAISKYINKEKK